MSTRERMVDAAAQVMRTRGLARATTKEIAKEAGFSEAALYKHFRDKTDLFLAVLKERVPSNLGALLAQLPGKVGQQPVEEVLRQVVRTTTDFYGQTFPMAASLYSEPQLLAAHRTALRERGAGPHAPRDALAGYLAAEQKLGRLNAEVDPEAAAQLLLGACLQTAFLATFTAQEDEIELDLVSALLTGLNPPRLNPPLLNPPRG